MSRKDVWFALVMALSIMAITPLHAGKRKEPAFAGPSVTKGDRPPGKAMDLSAAQAHAMLREAIKKRFVGTMRWCLGASVLKMCDTSTLSAATDLRVGASGFSFRAPYYDADPKVRAAEGAAAEGKESVDFKKGQDYIQACGVPKPSPSPLYTVCQLTDPVNAHWGYGIWIWADETAAQSFADAFNRLLYAAYRNEGNTEFSAAAKAWRQNPVKPPLSPEAERERVLAENAIKEKNLDSAIEHYESALEVQPTWPAGWFNLALIYAEQNNYADATNSMKHYLELVPDAPDAKDAREQIIIWEDKAKH